MIMSIQHTDKVKRDNFKNFVLNKIMIPTAKSYKLNTDFKFFINHAGDFIIGGLVGDTGLTGRKNIVDTYGGAARHGGGAFSGKDYTKVDRTGAYFARYIAKNVVAARLAKRCEIQLAFAIGSVKPVSMLIETFDTNSVPIDKIYQAVTKTFNFDLYSIVKTLKLDRPIYHALSVFGHFGRTDLKLE
jgi:S-adenosylmethionine synthetase